jgi:hypothetical protein
MPVIIDQMEVDTQPQGERSRGTDGGGGGGGGEPQQPKPEEVERALRQQLERAGRVWAH